MPAPGSSAFVLQSEDLEPAPAAWLAGRCTLEHRPFTDQPRFDALLARADALVVRTYTRVNADLLARAPRLRVVGRAGVGLDNIDIPACRARGVEVVHTPDANSAAVAEFVFASLLAALRPRVTLANAPDLGGWNALRAQNTALRELNAMTLGVYGMGRIGSRVARAGSGLGMQVLYHDIAEIDPARRHGAAPVPRDELLARADIVTLHVDPRPANRHLMNAAAFALMKPDAVFVNTSRGRMVDAHALAAHLRARDRALALIDVHDPEPYPPDYPLLGLPSARLTPHLAASTRTAHENMSWVVRDVWRVLRGEPPEHPAPA